MCCQRKDLNLCAYVYIKSDHPQSDKAFNPFFDITGLNMKGFPHTLLSDWLLSLFFLSLFVFLKDCCGNQILAQSAKNNTHKEHQKANKQRGLSCWDLLAKIKIKNCLQTHHKRVPPGRIIHHKIRLLLSFELKLNVELNWKVTHQKTRIWFAVCQTGTAATQHLTPKALETDKSIALSMLTIIICFTWITSSSTCSCWQPLWPSWQIKFSSTTYI